VDIKWSKYCQNGITFYGNSLKNPPVEIVKQGKEAIRQYFEGFGNNKGIILENNN